MRSRIKSKVQEIVKKQVVVLIDMAHRVWEKNPSLARRYCKLAFAMMKHNRVRYTKKNFLMCRRCFTPWIKGKTVTIEKRGPFLRHVCMHCGYKRSMFIGNDKEG